MDTINFTNNAGVISASNVFDGTKIVIGNNFYNATPDYFHCRMRYDYNNNCFYYNYGDQPEETIHAALQYSSCVMFKDFTMDFIGAAYTPEGITEDLEFVVESGAENYYSGSIDSSRIYDDPVSGYEVKEFDISLTSLVDVSESLTAYDAYFTATFCGATTYGNQRSFTENITLYSKDTFYNALTNESRSGVTAYGINSAILVDNSYPPRRILNNGNQNIFINSYGISNILTETKDSNKYAQGCKTWNRYALPTLTTNSLQIIYKNSTYYIFAVETNSLTSYIKVYSTTDFKSFTKISRLRGSWYGSMYFDENNTVYAIVRTGSSTYVLHKSEYPYTTWTAIPTGTWLQDTMSGDINGGMIGVYNNIPYYYTNTSTGYDIYKYENATATKIGTLAYDIEYYNSVSITLKVINGVVCFYCSHHKNIASNTNTYLLSTLQSKDSGATWVSKNFILASKAGYYQFCIDAEVYNNALYVLTGEVAAAAADNFVLTTTTYSLSIGGDGYLSVASQYNASKTNTIDTGSATFTVSNIEGLFYSGSCQFNFEDGEVILMMKSFYDRDGNISDSASGLILVTGA